MTPEESNRYYRPPWGARESWQVFATLPPGEHITAMVNYEGSLYLHAESGRCFRVDAQGCVVELTADGQPRIRSPYVSPLTDQELQPVRDWAGAYDRAFLHDLGIAPLE